MTQGILYILNRRLISRMQFKQVSALDEFSLHGILVKNLIKLRATEGEFLSSHQCDTEVNLRVMLQKKNDDNESCLLTPCMFRSTSYRSRSRCGKETPEPITGWKTGSRYFCWSPTALMEQRQVAFQKIYK